MIWNCFFRQWILFLTQLVFVFPRNQQVYPTCVATEFSCCIILQKSLVWHRSHAFLFGFMLSAMVFFARQNSLCRCCNRFFDADPFCFITKSCFWCRIPGAGGQTDATMFGRNYGIWACSPALNSPVHATIPWKSLKSWPKFLHCKSFHSYFNKAGTIYINMNLISGCGGCCGIEIQIKKTWKSSSERC